MRHGVWLLLASGVGWTAPAQAQVSGALSVDSDYRFRGYSLSAGRPTATAALYYDDLSGIYLAGSATGVLTGDGPELLGAQANVGYAQRLNTDMTIDGGLLRTHYFEGFSGRRNAHYTEVYLGLATRHLQSRISFSPDYFRSGVSTLYGEVEGSTELGGGMRLSGHAGALRYLSGYSPYQSRTRYDWRVALARRFGPAELRLVLSGRESAGTHYGRPSGDAAVVVGGSYVF